MEAFKPELSRGDFRTDRLLHANQPLSNNDPELKKWIATNGALYINRAVIGVREAIPGEKVETWVKGPDGPVLERSVIAEEGQLVAIGVLGERYVPSEANLRRNKIPVGQEGLREDEVAPPLPDDGHSYQLWRPTGDDYRMVVANPYDTNIYLLTSSGRLQVGVAGGKIAAQVGLRPGSGTGTYDPSSLDVARFIAPEEFAASYRPVAIADYSA